jgi:hypothetical protein
VGGAYFGLGYFSKTGRVLSGQLLVLTLAPNTLLTRTSIGKNKLLSGTSIGPDKPLSGTSIAPNKAYLEYMVLLLISNLSLWRLSRQDLYLIQV